MIGNLMSGINGLGGAFQSLSGIASTTAGGIAIAVAGFVAVIGGAFAIVGGVVNKFNEVFYSIVGTVAKVVGEVVGKVAEIAGAVIQMAGQVAGAVAQAGLAFTQFAIEVGQSAFSTFSRLDQLSRGLALYSDSAEDYRKTFKDLRELAKLPGLGLEEVMEATTSLRAAGLGAEKTRQSILGIGRALAAVGKGKGDFKGTMLALQQMVTAGKVEGDEIRQLSERVPQIRQVLLKAFGSAKGADISKVMEETGMTIYDVIDKINKELLKIPGTTASVAVNLENIQDDLKLAFAPIGQGIAQMVTAAMPGIGSLIEMFAKISTGIGEAFYAVGQSGVIQDALKSLIGGIDIESITMVARDIALRIVTFITAAVANIPKIYEAVKEAGLKFAPTFIKLWSTIVNEITYYFEVFKLYIQDVFKGLMLAIKPFMSAGKSLAEGDVAGAAFKMFMAPAASTLLFERGFNGRDGQRADARNAAMAELQRKRATGELGAGAGAGIQNFLQGLVNDTGLNKVQDAFGNVGRDAQKMYERSRDALAPLPEMIPDKFGNTPKEESLGAKTGKEDSNTLKEIAENTGKTADRLSLRTQTLGGGELAKLGVTGTELGNGGMPNVTTLMNRFPQGASTRPAESTLRSAPTQLEEAVSGVVRLNLRRGMGASVRL
jgi:tape measure domain-containing protein